MPHIRQVRLFPERYPTRECYPFSLRILQETPAVAFTAPVTCFVGENGTGKSTLLKAIALKCRIPIWANAESTRVEHNRYEEQLQRYIEVQWTDGPVPGSFFSAQLFHDFSAMLDLFAASDPGQLRYFGGKSLLTQSHGQSLMSYFTARYRLKGLYLLDEPESALSPKTQLALVRHIRAMAEEGHAQFIICTHSPILLACPGAMIYSFDQAPITTIHYEQTEHYRLYREFMTNPERHLTGEA